MPLCEEAHMLVHHLQKVPELAYFSIQRRVLFYKYMITELLFLATAESCLPMTPQ